MRHLNISTSSSRTDQQFPCTDRLAEVLSKHLPTSVISDKNKSKWQKLTRQQFQSIGEYSFDRLIGSGRHCEVRLSWREGFPYAVKLIPLSVIDDDFIGKLDRELRSLDLYHHRHIICIEEAIISHEHLGLVMQWARGGDLFHFLQLNGRISCIEQTQRWFAQLVSALDLLHTNSYVHHDIKPENILITKSGDVVLTDFEMGESFKRQGFPFVKSACGSVTYCAPEVMLSNSPYDGCKADVWALGVTLYTMIVGYLPFDDSKFNKSTVEEIAEQYIYIQSATLEFPDFVDPQLKNLISGMLDINPTKRFSLADIKKHPWLSHFADLWNAPTLMYGSNKHSAGSLLSDSSQQTVKTLLNTCPIDTSAPEFRKPVKGPIIWDPEASSRYWQAPMLRYDAR